MSFKLPITHRRGAVHHRPYPVDSDGTKHIVIVYEKAFPGSTLLDQTDPTVKAPDGRPFEKLTENEYAQLVAVHSGLNFPDKTPV